MSVTETEAGSKYKSQCETKGKETESVRVCVFHCENGKSFCVFSATFPSFSQSTCEFVTL